MFDLFRSRQTIVRVVLGGVLVVVSLSMLTYLIPNFGSGANDASDQIVAEVGKDVITLPEVTKIIQNQVKGRQLPPSILPNYIPQIVEGVIMERALAYQAGQLGFEITDADLQEAIRRTLPSLFQDGKFAGTDAYAATLAEQNFTIPEFESRLRTQLLVSRMNSLAVEGVIVTQAEVEREYRRKNDKVKIEWVKLTADKYRAESQPSAEDMQAYFKANAARYQLPEKKDITILLADPAKIEAGLTATDADLQRLYAKNRESFRTPERVRARHILLKTSGKTPEEEAKVRAKAEDLLKQIKGGANFADLAKKNSEDATSANNAKSPGELPDWVTRGQTVPEFEKAVFSLKPGQTSELVKTEYGYHIVQVLAHEDARVRPFEEAKADLATQWKKERVNEIMQNFSDKAQSELSKNAAHPETVAQAYGAQVARVSGYQANQPLPGVGASPDFDQSLGGLKVGDVSQPVALQDNQIAVALVTAVLPARAATLAEVEAQVRDALTQTRSAAALQKHAQDLLNAARNGGDFAKAAKAAGLEAKTSAEFTRGGTIDGVGSASYFQDVFGQPDGSLIGPVSVADGTVVARVAAHIPADMSKLPEQGAAIRDEVKNQKTRDRQEVFAEGVRDTLTKQKKIKVHQGVIQRIINSYSSQS
jgi:peptidyl-prolyl cis-trans isomerase D